MTDNATSDETEIETKESSLIIRRTFAASRERVWKAWTDPEQVIQWWGPNGFTTTVHEMDVKPDGVWRFVMHGPDGVDYPNEIVYDEIVEPERLVYTHRSNEENDPGSFQVTVTFVEQEDTKTELTMRQLYKSAAEFDKSVEEFGAIEGAIQTLDHLAEYVEQFEETSP
ncbi:SRPBCC family protein [Halocatena marina]|uniref:SRPBCC family protein n=1 Tax=Halocatena marina TaxID=2934937 RepID=A0ABD5YV21_9EURY|nr:SRPBCC family protein [Halocatena marina]